MMTKRTQTFTGLKSLLLIGSLGASYAGMQLLALRDGSASADSGEVPVVETETIPPQESAGFRPEDLQPIPTVVEPYVFKEPEPPVEQASNIPAVSSGGNNVGSASSSGGSVAPAPASGASIIPTVVAVGPLPPIPAAPAASGGGGGGGGGNNGGGGGGGGATSASS